MCKLALAGSFLIMAIVCAGCEPAETAMLGGTATASTAPVPDGHTEGTVLGDEVAFDAFSGVATTSAGVFDVAPVYFAAALPDLQSVALSGYEGAVLMYPSMLLADAVAPALVTFDYSDIDHLVTSPTGVTRMGPTGGTRFLTENFAINESVGSPPVPLPAAAPVPLPAAVWGGIVLFGVVGANRLRRRRRNAADSVA